MADCQFKYGDKVEVSDKEDFSVDRDKGRFIAHAPEHEFPYIISSGGCREYFTAWKFIRPIRPDLKPGQPVLVGLVNKTPDKLAFFHSWGQGDCIRVVTHHCLLKLDRGVSWAKWALLQNYDYSAPMTEGP